MTWGVYKGKTLREIHAFKPSCIEWLCKQNMSKINLMTSMKKQNNYWTN